MSCFRMRNSDRANWDLERIMKPVCMIHKFSPTCCCQYQVSLYVCHLDMPVAVCLILLTSNKHTIRAETNSSLSQCSIPWSFLEAQVLTSHPLRSHRWPLCFRPLFRDYTEAGAFMYLLQERVPSLVAIQVLKRPVLVDSQMDNVARIYRP